MVATRNRKEKCLVTGGAGFLGKHLINQLLEKGTYEVSVLDVRDIGDSRVKMIVADLRNLAQVETAVQGMDVVFHCATVAPAAGNTGNEKLMHSVNVTGTENMIAACQAQHVPKLVYTSSASVVFNGTDLLDVDETHPYADSFLDYYTKTKIEGEKLVLAANGKGGLSTVALRPSGIFGPGDQLTLPTVVANARKGKTKFYIGSGKNNMDWTYVGNVAQAHIQAAEALSPGSKLAGQAYFVTNDEPDNMWGFLGDLLAGLDYPRPKYRMPTWLAYLIACIIEFIVAPLLKPFMQVHMELNRFRVKVLSCERRVSCKKAREHFGYVPQVSLAEGKRRTIEAFSHLRNNAGSKKAA